MSNGAYLLVLFIGAVTVAIDGQVILRKSPAYLDEVYQNLERSKQVAGMVAVLFHLVMLGMVALVGSVGGVESGVRPIITRVGVMLLLVALGHAITMTVLSRLRDQELSTQVNEAEGYRAGSGQQPGVGPEGAAPRARPGNTP
ncbi:MAG TPA: hypothetical protein VGM60_18280 [Pseudonocardia sp.]|uniref:hypothetical protein n=1 Tax=Pseudonocardia sp. TaxID=60912 RepID=UPI002F41BB9F